MSDIGNSVWSETDANNNTAAPQGFPENMAPSGVNDAARAVMGATKRWFNQINGTVTSGGTANAQTLTYSVAPGAYFTGMRFLFKVGVTNTGSATLNVHSLGAKTIKDMYGNALVGSELTLNSYAEVIYDGTDMILLRTAQYLGPTFVWKKSLSGANVDWDPLPTGFARWQLLLYDVIVATDGAGLDVLVKVSSFQTSGYVGALNDTDSLAPANTAAAQAAGGIRLSSNLGNAAGEWLNAILDIFNVDGTTLHKKADYRADYTTNAGTHIHRKGWGAYAGGAGAVTGLRLIPTAGNITSGTGVLIGHRVA